MKIDEVLKLFEKFPRKQVTFLPTPFHKLNNLSEDLGVEIYFKREDLSGPSNFGGNKTRKLEFILAKAVEEGIEYIITSGSFQTNSAMECTQFCNLNNIKTIVYIGDVTNEGIPEEYRGNILLMKILGAELNYVLQDPPEEGSEETKSLNALWDKVALRSEERKLELEKAGHKAMIIPMGSAHPEGFISYILALIEIIQQSEELGVKMDYVINTTGTGGSLPGLVAGKLMLGCDFKILSMAIIPYGENEPYSKKMILDRVKHIYSTLEIEAPSDETILDAFTIVQDYYGEGYGIPTEEATKAIHTLARREAIFVDPVYTGKGLAGTLDYIEKGIIPQGSKVAFIHSGGTGAIFAEKTLTGNLAGE